MISILLLWVLVLFVFYTIGFSVVKVIKALPDINNAIETDPDEYFFLGFLTLSALTGFISVFTPLGYPALGCVVLLTILLFWMNNKEILSSLEEYREIIKGLTRWELAFLIFLFIFILTSVVQKITLGDTESYHAQSIQWIRKYAVVPGLGNIHGRLAFNSMFLVISGLFTFQINDILIFPLNGICYIVLTFKLFFLFKKENNPGSEWKAVFYILLLLSSLLIVITDLNSPSADIICATLIIYTFVLLMKSEANGGQINHIQIVLLNVVIFSCIAFKISSLFLIVSLLLIYNQDIFRRIWITAFIGFFILSSFIIRNYYLSGYLIYPFPSVDIFTVDWKIPVGNALSEKIEIESWAKISTIPALDVMHMRLTDWFLPWFHSLNFIKKLLIGFNLFSVIPVTIMILKKDYFFLKIQLILFLNLLFWFLNAPDPRFALGFLFVGFSLCMAYFLKSFKSETIFKYIRIAFACMLLLIFCRRIMFPVDTLIHPSRWVIPAPFGTVATNEYFSDFHYRVPVPEGGCFNVDIPCVPYPLTNIVLRGKNIQDGFKIKKQP
jgi:hypothetical protein